MLSTENLEKFIKIYQTDIENVLREYFQHLFLSFLYQQRGSERLLFKGGTALRIILKSPRFSEDLDFTGHGIVYHEIENLFTNTLVNLEKTGILVEIHESKPTTGGYIGIAVFRAYDYKISIRIEISLRTGKNLNGTRTMIQSDYIPPYTLVHLPTENIIAGKLQALLSRQKPRDFYDYFFLLSGNYPLVKEKKNLEFVLNLLQKSKINFRAELKKFLPESHSMHLRDFKKILGQKILTFLSKE